MSKKCLWSDVEMTFENSCLLDVDLKLCTNINQIWMSKQCLWSDVEMTFAIRCVLDVEFGL